MNEHNDQRARLKLSSLFFLALFANAPALPAYAAEVHRFDITTTDSATAIHDFATQSGVQILVAADVVTGKRFNAVSGAHSTDEGLRLLLAGTGLTPKYMGERAVALVTDTPAGSSRTIESSTAPPVEEIVVTAQKRLERLIDVPQSVSVLSGETLTRSGAAEFRDFADSIPGLTFTTTGAGKTQISLRGVTIGFDSSPTVGVYVDEVPYGSSSSFSGGARLALDVGLFDLDRIEVLRGPQGTLYGASTMGGLLKYVTKRPSVEAPGIDARAGISGTEDGGFSYNGAATLNMPLPGDKAAVRTSGYYSRTGGYIDNLSLDRRNVDRSDVYGGRMDFLMTPIEELSIRLTGFLQNIYRDGETAGDFSRAGSPVDGSLDQRRLLPESFDQEFRLVSATLGYRLGAVSLTSISSYQTTDSFYVVDRSARFVPLLASFGQYSAAAGTVGLSTDKLTQEVRIASAESRWLEWVVGAFYTDEKSDNVQGFLLQDVSNRPAPNVLGPFGAPTKFEETAGFGDLTWHVTERLAVAGGIRYAENRQTFEQIGAGLLGAGLTTPPRSSSENVFTYLANARYAFGDRATGYVRYATGYRPGGPNFVATDPVTGVPLAPAEFAADELKSYEAGIKAETASGRFGVDFATYYSDWNNLQVATARGGYGVLLNAPGGASVRGAELSLTVRPITRFTLTSAFAYQDAHMSEADVNLRARNGERLPNVPHFTAAVNADFGFVRWAWSPTLGASIRHVSERTGSFDASTQYPQYRLPEYTMVDLRAGFAVGNVDAQLYLRNVFDERAQLSASTYIAPEAQVAILQPRTLGIVATARF
jgi:iron complex outermembrane recepter protein